MAKSGAVGKILSILSRKPPCPGSILPESSLLEFLLKTLTTRSPTTENKPIHIENKIIIILLSKLLISEIMKAVRVIANKPENKPSQVFFGLIRIANFDFPNFFPPKYDPISIIHIIKRKIKKYLTEY